MRDIKNLLRKSHFLGTKIRNLRKRNGLTMDDMSARCVKIDAEAAPSVSYLSMIERGKRIPSVEVLEIIAQVFQKDIGWFLDDSPDQDHITPTKQGKGGLDGMSLEPSFLFSSDILQIAIPEMLAQTGTTGRQFAHLLIRAYQELHQNHFPDLERAAEEVGGKKLPISVDDLMQLLADMDIKVRWFKKTPPEITGRTEGRVGNILRSYFDPPGTLYLSESLRNQTARLKYDLAFHIGHCTLHDRQGMPSVLYAGRDLNISMQSPADPLRSSVVDSQDILHAWRDFECSFFAGALLCPKVPFRQLLDRQSYDVATANIVGVSPSVVMRRMTAVSPYPHWHYFDAYEPGILKAVYRANGIPLPWGNMKMVEDPCEHWAVFRGIHGAIRSSHAQISVMQVKDDWHLYACETILDQDMADNGHVLCAGVDLMPALKAQDRNAAEVALRVKEACVANGGSAPLPENIRRELLSVARILNIGWIEEGIDNPAQLICARGRVCPRVPSCSHG